MELAILLVCVVGFTVVILLERNGMGQTEELKSAVSQVGVDLGEAVSRVEAKIAALGEPDPDLSAEIANLRRFSEQLDSLAAEAPAPEPEPAPEPAPEPGEGGDVPPGPLGGRRR